MQRSKGSLFDQPVGERKQILRNIEAERFGGCEVDDQLDLDDLLDRQIGGRGVFKTLACLAPAQVSPLASSIRSWKIMTGCAVIVTSQVARCLWR